MKRTLKTLSTLLLICFISTSLVGSAAMGDENVEIFAIISNLKKEAQIGYIKPSQIFYLTIKGYYKGEILKDTKIIEANGFKVSERKVLKHAFPAGAQETIFKLEAPSKPGNYVLTFEGRTSENKVFTFKYEIKVAEAGMGELIVKILWAVGALALFYFMFSGPKGG